MVTDRDRAVVRWVAVIAVKLERTERVEVWGEPRLRAAESEAERPIASAELGQLPDGRPRLRRPDLVLFPDAALPVAVEVDHLVRREKAWPTQKPLQTSQS